MVRVFASGPGDLGSIPGRVIPKTQKMVLDASLLNTRHYKVRIKSKVGQSREKSSTPLHLGVVAIEKGAFGSPSTKGRQLYLLLLQCVYYVKFSRILLANKKNKDLRVYIHTPLKLFRHS